MDDNDLAFICKTCHQFYTDSEVKAWDTKWEVRNGEKWLPQIIHKCPLCGEIRSYVPNESVFRFRQKATASTVWLAIVTYVDA